MAFAPVVHTRTCERHARGCSQIKSEALVKRDVYVLKEMCTWSKEASVQPFHPPICRATPVPAFLSPPSSGQGCENFQGRETSHGRPLTRANVRQEALFLCDRSRFSFFRAHPTHALLPATHAHAYQDVEGLERFHVEELDGQSARLHACVKDVLGRRLVFERIDGRDCCTSACERNSRVPAHQHDRAWGHVAMRSKYAH